MTHEPFLLGQSVIARTPRRETYWCACGIRFVGTTRGGVVRQHADHRAEMRDPDAHDGGPF